MTLYDLLLKNFGGQNWWPGETPFEVIIGAILTQNTAWQNVEVAIMNLKEKGLLTPEGIYNAKEDELEKCIRPAGYFRIKTKRLKGFITFLFEEFNGDLDKLFSLPLPELRSKLLEVYGIGPETADSIILYAGEKPTFVVDAYTKRIFSRLGILNNNLGYDDVKRYFEDNLSKNIELYNEYHALIVMLGKNYCKTRPICDQCPLKSPCDYPIQAKK